MSLLDLIYLLLLISSIPLGCLVKSCGRSKQKEWLCFMCGVSITLGLNGVYGSIHSFLTIVGNYAIVKLCKVRYCPLVSFVFVFAYLLFYRLCTLVGLPQPPKHSNAVQLLVTLRMISLSFEISDDIGGNAQNGAMVDSADTGSTCTNKEFAVKDKHNISATFFDFMAYGYCYIGLLTGPFYTYKTFKDMLNDSDRTSTFWLSIKNLKLLPFLAVVYLLLKDRFPLENLKKEEFFVSSFTYSFCVMTFTAMWFRWRFYIGWLLAESSCISCGLGAYPDESEPKPGAGPTKPIPIDRKPGLDPTGSYAASPKPPNFKTVYNIKIFEVELGTSMKEIMRDWNMTVQWWISTYVYKRLPFKSYYLKLVITLSVSAFWHGIHPGYYLSFLSATLMVFAQSNINKFINLYMNANTRYVYDWLAWFCLFRYIEYIAVPFMLLEFRLVWRIWSKMYFFGHLLVFCAMVIPLLIGRKKGKL